MDACWGGRGHAAISRVKMNGTIREAVVADTCRDDRDRDRGRGRYCYLFFYHQPIRIILTEITYYTRLSLSGRGLRLTSLCC